MAVMGLDIRSVKKIDGSRHSRNTKLFKNNSLPRNAPDNCSGHSSLIPKSAWPNHVTCPSGGDPLEVFEQWNVLFLPAQPGPQSFFFYAFLSGHFKSCPLSQYLILFRLINKEASHPSWRRWLHLLVTCPTWLVRPSCWPRSLCLSTRE